MNKYIYTIIIAISFFICISVLLHLFNITNSKIIEGFSRGSRGASSHARSSPSRSHGYGRGRGGRARGHTKGLKPGSSYKPVARGPYRKTYGYVPGQGGYGRDYVSGDYYYPSFYYTNPLYGYYSVQKPEEEEEEEEEEESNIVSPDNVVIVTPPITDANVVDPELKSPIEYAPITKFPQMNTEGTDEGVFIS